MIILWKKLADIKYLKVIFFMNMTATLKKIVEDLIKQMGHYN